MLHTRIPGERTSRSVTPATTGAANGNGAILVVVFPLVVALAGCQDAGSLTAPVLDALPTAASVGATDLPQGLAAGQPEIGPASAADAIEDALERVLPALEESGPTTAIEAGLRQLQSQLEGGTGRGLQRALAEVRNAVDGFQARAGEEFQADISVVQLALDALADG